MFQLENQIDNKFKTFLEKKEKVQIASSYISTNYILPPIIASYKLENPEVDVYVSLGNVQSVEQRVLNYEVDFGFVVQSNINHEDLSFEKILDIPFWFVVHPKHPLANKDVPIFELSEHAFIYRERGSSTFNLLEAIFYTHNCHYQNASGRLARVFVQQGEINQSLYICTRRMDEREHPFIHYLKNIIKSES